MALYSRHPRFTIALLILIFVSALLFTNSEPQEPLFKGFSRQDALAESLRIEETHYQKMLVQRQDLIKKWGPTPDKITNFPSNGEFYTVWDFFLPSYNCPHHVERIGVMGDGGKWICGLDRIASKKKCVIYSFGLNGESSFEADLMKAAPGCELYGYDFSVNSFGPEIEHELGLKNRSHFYPFALGSKNAFTLDDNPKTYTLRTLMKLNGHSFIDVLKIDIEGHEFDSLEVFIDSFLGEPLPFGQLQLEVHLYGDSRDSWPDITFSKVLRWWEKLEAAGLRPYFSEPNVVYMNLLRNVQPGLIEYSLINIRGHHELITDRPQPYPLILE